MVEDHFVLRETRNEADFVGLPEVPAGQGRWVVLKFDANEAQRLLAMRQGLQEKKARSGGSVPLEERMKMRLALLSGHAFLMTSCWM